MNMNDTLAAWAAGLPRCAACGGFAATARARYCTDCKRERHLETHKRHNAKRRGQIQRYKVLVGCERCGYNRCAEALDIHHSGDKRFMFSTRRATGATAVAELRNCEVLCANCHREEHARGR